MHGHDASRTEGVGVEWLLRGQEKPKATIAGGPPKEARMITTIFSRISMGIIALTGLLAFSAAGHARDYLKGERPQQRGYSEAVITEGGRMIWLAGQTATVDDAGRSLAADFDGQVRQLFKNLDRTLQKAGGKLGDMVQMTVFITDVRTGDRLTQSAEKCSVIISQAAPSSQSLRWLLLTLTAKMHEVARF